MPFGPIRPCRPYTMRLAHQLHGGYGTVHPACNGCKTHFSGAEKTEYGAGLVVVQFSHPALRLTLRHGVMDYHDLPAVFKQLDLRHTETVPADRIVILPCRVNMHISLFTNRCNRPAFQHKIQPGNRGTKLHYGFLLSLTAFSSVRPSWTATRSRS